MNTISVATNPGYQVLVGRNILASLTKRLNEYHRVAVIYPEPLIHLAAKLLPQLVSKLTMIGIPDGEKAKTPANLFRIWNKLAESGFTRSDAILGLGGGATTDLAGFAAASFLRGIAYYAAPTSVLAMVDAAVGGKTGINLESGKNLVGAFYEPKLVVCDLGFLSDLPEAELKAGFGEIIKAGFISDNEILTLVEENNPPEIFKTDSLVFSQLITKAIAVKAKVVSNDLRERTSIGVDVGRELLNYGHTFAHAIEKQENYLLRHGEAVAIGMVFAANLAEILELSDSSFTKRQRQLIAKLGLPIQYQGDIEQLIKSMKIDKKARGVDIRFILLRDIAKPCACSVTTDRLRQAYVKLNATAKLD